MGRQACRANQGGNEKQFCLHKFQFFNVFHRRLRRLPHGLIDPYRSRHGILQKNWKFLDGCRVMIYAAFIKGLSLCR